MKEALTTFIQTGKYFSPNIKEKILDKFMNKKNLNHLEKLSDREMEIALLYIKGYGNLEISLMKMIQPTTVSTYKKRIFEKLHIDNIVSLIDIFNSYNETY
jgi:DNA-binding NarL/FixJ family response regulator